MMPVRQGRPRKDWDKADIKAGLEKRGYTFNRIARENGYARKSQAVVLHRRCAAMERIVAGILGVALKKSGPSRYTGKTGKTG